MVTETDAWSFWKNTVSVQRIKKLLARPIPCEIPPSWLRNHLMTGVLRVRPGLRIIILALTLTSTLCALAIPYTQRALINTLTQDTLGFTMGLLAITFALSIISQAIALLSRLLATREGMAIQRSLSRSLYQHTLHLSQASRAKYTVGETTTFYAQDVQAMVSFVEDLLPALSTTLISVVAAPMALTLFFRTQITPVLLVLGISISISLWLGIRQAIFFARNKENAQARLSVVNEWIQNIRAIRILDWTQRFEEKITERRQVETNNRLGMVTNGSTMNSLTQVAPLLVNVTAVFTLVSTANGELTAGDIFSILWVCNVFLARPLRSLPFMVLQLNDGLTSARRLQTFFREVTETSPLSRQETPPAEANFSDNGLTVRNLTLTLDNRTLLSNLSFDIAPGEFVAIIGEVGAGKSILLQSLLRLVPSHFAEYRIGKMSVQNWSLAKLRCNFGYVPQDGFIMSARIRDNVAFQYPQDTDVVNAEDEHELNARILDALNSAQFALTHEGLQDGLATEIGERGVNLSGGQRQRVSLARAAFRGRPILLLDDCLSAVDQDTESRLVEDLLCGRWAHHTRLLVTHRLSVLPFTDRVLFLAEGKLIADSTYDKLMSTSPAFRAFVNSLSSQDGRESTDNQENEEVLL